MTKTIPKQKKCKKAKSLSEEALQIVEKRREAKEKGEMERYTHLNAEFQRIARRDKKAFISKQCKEIEEGNRIKRLSHCLFNFYAEYIMRNVWLDESQAVIKISGRNINTLRCADDTTLMVESEEELKSLLISVKEESGKAGLKLNIQKTKIKASGLISSWQIDGKTVADFIFLGSKISADSACSHEIKNACSLEGKL